MRTSYNLREVINLDDLEKANRSARSNFTPTSISWHNIEVFAKEQKRFYKCVDNEKAKKILHKISGEVKVGQFLAIMGSSGAGKTSLLNVLTAKNLSKVEVKGVVKLNGQVANASQIAFISAYVQQNDLFIPMLTVREHLQFQAALRLDQTMTKEERDRRVEEVMQEFSLTKCSETRIGSSTTFKGISGGESKRLAFASEVLTNPSIMFCDEPTCGLDSFMAENIVNVMKSMASQGRTVICTIHQPSTQVFNMFEKLLLLADGRVAFMGDRGEATNFFASLGYICSTKYNPADFFIKELSIAPGSEAHSKQKIHNICDKFLRSSHATDILNDTDYSNTQNSFELSSTTYDQMKSEYKSSFWRQFSNLIWRSFLSNGRNPTITRTRITQSIFYSIMLGVVFYHQNISQLGVKNMNGAMYCVLLCLSIMSSMAVNIFSEGLPVFLREHQNKMYRVDAYYISTVLIQIPIFTIVPILFTCLYYFMVGLNPGAAQFFIHMIITILMTNCAVSFAYLISSLSSGTQLAATITAPIMLPLGLFGGYYLNASTFPKWLFWFKYLSWYNYGFSAMVINQWRDIDQISCDHPAQNYTSSSTLCLRNGLAVIDHYDINPNELALNCCLMIVLSLCLQIIAFIVLSLKSRKTT